MTANRGEVMLQVEGSRIFLTRGDTAFLVLHILDSAGNPYNVQEGDKIYFRLKSDVFSRQLIIEKEIDINSLRLQLDPEDTEDLSFTTYKYEIELVTSTGYHFTIIENSEFVIRPELEVHA